MIWCQTSLSCHFRKNRFVINLFLKLVIPAKQAVSYHVIVIPACSWRVSSVLKSLLVQNLWIPVFTGMTSINLACSCMFRILKTLGDCVAYGRNRQGNNQKPAAA
jgi:hypothetical protein